MYSSGVQCSVYLYVLKRMHLRAWHYTKMKWSGSFENGHWIPLLSKKRPAHTWEGERENIFQQVFFSTVARRSYTWLRLDLLCQHWVTIEDQVNYLWLIFFFFQIQLNKKKRKQKQIYYLTFYFSFSNDNFKVGKNNIHFVYSVA